MTAVVVGPHAVVQIEAIDRSWRVNRTAAPALFAEELAAAIELIRGAPRIGRRSGPRDIPSLRRVLLRASRYHLHYAPSADSRELFVLAVWSAVRGSGPPLAKRTRGR